MTAKRSVAQSENHSSFATDERGSDGSNHAYAFFQRVQGGPGEVQIGQIKFQNGPVSQAGVNGVTDEQVLSVLIDHVEGFQRGPYNSNANQQAAWHLHEALNWLRQRPAASGQAAQGKQ